MPPPTLKAVVINLGDGDLNSGFPRVTVQLWVSGYSRPQQFIGSLPAAPILAELYSNWQLIYKHLCNRMASMKDIRRQSVAQLVEVDVDDELEIELEGITNISQDSFNQVCYQLEQNINAWLHSPGFLNVDRQVRARLDSSSEIHVMIETNNDLLRHLPWHCWQFFGDYPQAEPALSQPEYQREGQAKRETTKVRLLAILGSSKGIDLKAEQRFLQDLQEAKTEFLVNPSYEQLNQQLRNTQGWDILFFAGHSQTEGETGRIYLNENPTNNSLTIEQLQEALKVAIANGLKLAIFNSCDGLGLANSLEKLHIPTVIVMREPVPNRVAQEFFRHFLSAFAFERLSLYRAVRYARQELKRLEADFPGASWLPTICQNPAVEPPIWLNIAEPLHFVLTSSQIYELEKVLLDLIGPIAPILLQNVLAQVGNRRELIEQLKRHLSPSQQEKFQQQVNLELTQPLLKLEDRVEMLIDQYQVLDENFIRQCEQALTQAIGPIAHILIQQTLSSGEHSRVTFVESLAAKLPNPQLALAFKQQVLG
ncbi:CHAT domain-containing protein [Scytonema sp. NUACC26]|uniref:CHAT domain-containing protein n=1 Tax=Scytonema sp. NUACC26 TaxID=3140176 RepID=UPI0034DC9841